MTDTFFCLVIDNCGNINQVLGPYNDFEYAKDKIAGQPHSVVTKIVTHGTNQYGAPENYQGLNYPAPIDDYVDED